MDYSKNTSAELKAMRIALGDEVTGVMLAKEQAERDFNAKIQRLRNEQNELNSEFHQPHQGCNQTLTHSFKPSTKGKNMTKTPLTQLEFSDSDCAIALRMAAKLGYEQTAYTSTSALIGLFCLPENPALPENKHKPHCGGCIIKTEELGFLFVQTAEELHI